jgi:hypothetical protein
MRRSSRLGVPVGALVLLALVGRSNALLGTPRHVEISPPSATVAPGASQTFHVSSPYGCCASTWTFVRNESGGSLQASGIFRALYTAGPRDGVDQIQVTVLNSTERVSATVAVRSLIVSPPGVTLPPSGTQVFTVSGGSGPDYTWEFVINASGGSLTSAGVYTAGATGDVTDTIRVVDASGHTGQVTAAVTSAVTLSPPSAALPPLGNQAFTASGGSGTGYVWVAYTASGGSVTQDGVYTAGPVNGARDFVTVTDSLGNVARALVTVGVPAVPLTITPSDVAVPVGTTVAFRAAGGFQPYRWAVETNTSGGHATTTGFRCRQTGLSFCFVTGDKSGVTDVITLTDFLGVVARATVRVGGLAITPRDVTLVVRATQTFVASGGSDAGYTWTLATNSSEGSIDPVTGRYTAGTTAPTTDVVQVTDSDGASAMAQVHVIYPPMLTASPSTSTLPPRGSEDFMALGGTGAGYSWAFVDNPSGGTLSATGGYTAGATGDVTDVIRLTDSGGHSADAEVNVTAALRLSPETVTLLPHQSQSFIVSGGSGSGTTWMLSTNRSGGTLTAGIYTAGATGGVTDIVTVTDSLGAVAEARITVPTQLMDFGCGATGGTALPALALLLLPLLARLRRRSIGQTFNRR